MRRKILYGLLGAFLIASSFSLGVVLEANAAQAQIFNAALAPRVYPNPQSTNQSGQATVSAHVELIVILGRAHETAPNQTWIAEQAAKGYYWVPDCAVFCFGGVKYALDPTVHLTNNGIDFMQCKLGGTSGSITCTAADLTQYVSVSASGGYTPLFTDTACHATVATTNGFSITAGTITPGTPSGGSVVWQITHTWTGATAATASIDLACLQTEASGGGNVVLYAMGQIGTTTVNVGDTLQTIWQITYASS